MLENLSYIIAIVTSIAGATWFISKKLTCAERNSNLAMNKIEELEEQIIEETRSADDHHRRMYDKIDELKSLIMSRN
jgi:hypothetical protein|tara:strand:+ start:1338 stop:1568 length:231 start_codon:yes stop_codon:yes gene_type:complete